MYEYEQLSPKIGERYFECANRHAKNGWRAVALIDSRYGSGPQLLLLEREIPEPLVKTDTEARSLWIGFYWDFSGFVIFNDEVQALRYAEEHHMEVRNVPLGQELVSFLNNA